MTDVRNRVLKSARDWLGTPYVHQMSCRGAGCDCLGLIRGVWRDIYMDEPATPPPYSKDWSEVGHSETLWEAARVHLRPVGQDVHVPGDVILFRMRETGVAKHLGIASFRAYGPTFIHAYSGHGVVESPLSRPWQRRIVARFAFPQEN